jgi:thioredoxin-like negative regulator of GroEL
MHAFRSGHDDDAVAVLGQLVDDRAPDWTLAVAYQELAHLLLRRQRPEQAVRLLETAVTRLPEVQRLYLELAYALDRSGRRREARELLAGLPPDTGRPSPRLLYRVPPTDVDRRSRAALLRHATARLPVLADALAASSAAPSG